MHNADTPVQLRRNTPPENVWALVPDPLDPSDDVGIQRMSIDVKDADWDLLNRFAAYRNALAEASGKKLKKKWSRKQMAESMLAIQCDALRHQLSEMVATLGEIPSADDEAAIAKYAKRVISWDKKLPK